MRSLLQDTLFALRTLRRRPAFAAIAVATIALGIAAATAMFSVVDGVLLRPLPYEDSGRLVAVFRTYPHWRGDPVLNENWDRISFSFPTFKEWRARQTAFTDVGVYSSSNVIVTGLGTPERVLTLRASASLLPLLGVRAVVGRTFLPGEDEPSAPRLALLGHAFWTSRFGGDPAAVGRTITLDEQPFEIVGVLPPGVDLYAQRNPPSVVINAGLEPFDLRADNNRYRAVGRLKPGITLERASAETERIVRGDEDPAKLGVRLAFWQQEQTVRARAPLLILLGAAGMLLLIGCVNVAMLLLGEAAAREHEMASRVALGASRWRLARQLLTESLVLATLGAALGVALAFAGTRALVALAPADVPRLSEVVTDLRVLAFATLVTATTGVLFGLLPAASLSTASPALLLRGGSRTATRRRGSAQRVLVAAELALCLVLLVGAGLLARSLALLTAVDPGFRTSNLLVMRVGLSRGRYGDSTRVREFYRSATERLAAIPGVERVSGSTDVPFSVGSSSTSFEIVGQPPAASGNGHEAFYALALPGFFETMGIPLLAGRTIAGSDDADAPPVMVVNETFARAHWPNESAVGQLVSFSEDTATVVGIVGDVTNDGLDSDVLPMVYIPAAREPRAVPTFVVRTRGDPAGVAGAARRVIAAIDPDVPVVATDPMPALIAKAMTSERYRTVLISLFAVIAAVLAAVGVYGVTSRAVSQQTREIGIRMALGATGGGVARLYLGRTMLGAAVGLVVGVAGAAAAGRLLVPYLFGIGATDPVTFATVVATLTLVSLAACWLPARRAARANPAMLLREN